MSDSNTPQHIYDHLWANARAAFDAGEIVPDPWLGRGDDTRRGLTLIARPDAPTRERIAAFIEDLQGCAPDQYFYRPDQLHITVLALVAASEAFDLARVPVAQYETALADLFAGCAPFRVRIDQVVAAPDAVIVCGDADGGALNALRDRLRERLHAAGLGDGLDRRYRSVTAHMTVMRYRRPPDDLPALAAFLDASRARTFGTFAVEQITMVTNDWYMTPGQIRVLTDYRLGVQTGNGE